MGESPSLYYHLVGLCLERSEVPTLRHDDVRDELLGGLSDAGRRQFEGFAVVYEARQVASQLGELRTAVGLSQREVAKRAGVDQADLSRIESAQVIPSLPTLLRLLDVVGGTLVVAHKRVPRRQSSKATTTTTGAVESVRPPTAAVERAARTARAARTTPAVRSSAKTAAAAKRSA
jgi:transcriptional regulator with XRE-family HTH domain